MSTTTSIGTKMTNSISNHPTTTTNNSFHRLFELDTALLDQTIDLLQQNYTKSNINYTSTLQSLGITDNITPPHGTNASEVINQLVPHLVGGATKLYSATYSISMDCPTINIAHCINLCSVYMNQNMLHYATSPIAHTTESLVIQWLCELCDNKFDGGQMTVGATVATLTALWCARDHKLCHTVITSDVSHLSIEKCARILGMKLIKIKSDRTHHMKLDSIKQLNLDLAHCAVVITVGTTITGSIDECNELNELNAGWIHIDGAWGGPLQFTQQYKPLISPSIQYADSFCMSAHKLLMQPKGTAIILFKQWDIIKKSISFGGVYLTHPNVGVLGSKSAMSESLLGTLLVLGKSGISQLIHQCMYICEQLYQCMCNDSRFIVLMKPETGCLIWRINEQHIINTDYVDQLVNNKLCTSAVLDNITWCRNVSCNPCADPQLIYDHICKLCF